MFIYQRCDCKECKITKNFPDSRVMPVAGLLKLVSVPSRLNILLLLKQSPHCVCDIQSHTKLSQTLISHHLADLMKAGLVAGEKAGKFIEYSLTGKGKKIVANLVKLF
ncbi:MAG: metalloregulator ArsR/SmtB family transcription factor [Candidatus Doudnabacteria bacterium]|nr:metalloregulator ArsR/SmtB family transcription factor [Candidatus Doudnabacteria bacterium]